jgi:putative peptidoglycan lipid II flippase
LTSLRKATAIMSVGTVLSRVTGLVKIFAIAAALGIAEPGSIADAFNLANTAPNIIYELVLGGILTSIFVPVFVELLEKEGKERAWEVASSLINLSLIVLTALATLGILAAPLIAKVYTLNLEGAQVAEQQEVLTFLLRLFIPQVIFYGLAALTAGLLNAHKRFGPPMFTPVLNNLTVIAVFLLFRQAYDKVSLGNATTSQLLLIGLGTTAGVAVMAIAQLPFLRGLAKYSFKVSLGHPSVKKLAGLSVFVIGYVIANQIGYLVVQVLAAGEPGGYAAYVYAFTFFMLPHGLFAVSVITALLPGMSEFAVNENWAAFNERLSTGVRATLFLVLPAAVGYLVLGEPIVRLLIEHGNATARSTELVNNVLRFFVLGLVPFSLFQLFLRAFYAMQNAKTPFLINCGAVLVNVMINIPLFKLMGVEGLAGGHALSYVFGVTMQTRYLKRRTGGLDRARVASSTARIGAAAAGMGGGVWLAWKGLEGVGGAGLLAQLVQVGIPVFTGVVLYLGLAVAFKVEELQLVRGLVTRRRGADITREGAGPPSEGK